MPTTYLTIDIGRVNALVSVAKERDGGLHVLAGGVSNLWVAKRMLEKTRELLQAVGESLIHVNDDFDAKTLLKFPVGTLFFFSEIRKQDEHAHSFLVVEQCLNAGGTVFAVVHGKNVEMVAERLLMLGMPNTILDTKLSVESFIAEIP